MLINCWLWLAESVIINHRTLSVFTFTQPFALCAAAPTWTRVAGALGDTNTICVPKTYSFALVVVMARLKQSQIPADYKESCACIYVYHMCNAALPLPFLLYPCNCFHLTESNPETKSLLSFQYWSKTCLISVIRVSLVYSVHCMHLGMNYVSVSVKTFIECFHYSAGHLWHPPPCLIEPLTVTTMQVILSTCLKYNPCLESWKTN